MGMRFTSLYPLTYPLFYCIPYISRMQTSPQSCISLIEDASRFFRSLLLFPLLWANRSAHSTTLIPIFPYTCLVVDSSQCLSQCLIKRNRKSLLYKTQCGIINILHKNQKSLGPRQRQLTSAAFLLGYLPNRNSDGKKTKYFACWQEMQVSALQASLEHL